MQNLTLWSKFPSTGFIGRPIVETVTMTDDDSSGEHVTTTLPPAGVRRRRLGRLRPNPAPHQDKTASPDVAVAPALAAGIALVVAVFGVVGVAGDYLTRAIRNSTGAFATIFIIALLAVSVPIIISLLKLAGNFAIGVSVFAVIVLVGSLIGAIILGSKSVATDEQPKVSLSATQAKDGPLTLTVDASATGVRAAQRVLIQLVGLTTATDFDKATNSLCGHSYFPVGIPSESGTLLLWQVSGPDTAGSVSTKVSLDVPIGTFEAACAFVALPDGDPTAFTDDRESVAFVKLLPIVQLSG